MERLSLGVRMQSVDQLLAQFCAWCSSFRGRVQKKKSKTKKGKEKNQNFDCREEEGEAVKPLTTHHHREELHFGPGGGVPLGTHPYTFIYHTYIHTHTRIHAHQPYSHARTHTQTPAGHQPDSEVPCPNREKQRGSSAVVVNRT
ncbi:uncharacterized protein BO66DRAFT_394186 [Aspergillus aculeatinus CBS 121060]|uniref:Uncharacterized protein n=1 Tax=Aspergillus aculeatinus CBS 121060 TaxID=1448322 RepID=A0ACD1H051_9EURO|nr:hypothetical protein BO66DRAFT_394186 [Aspergillus aculeatinus CBS 121060]RAH66912.1 hypothetical protein BO66DRAFT_394186 [Aspergillus aculeatinus CBS 121060]